MLEKTMSSFQNKLKKGGGIVIYPTETAYAIGCDATNQRAVDLIFKIKKRPKNKPLPLIAGSLAMVKRYCRLSKEEEKLARQYWPGPLTLILNIKYYNIKYLAEGVVAKDGTVAIRVSSHPIARALSRRLGRPIVSTSANLSGAGECYSVAEVRKQLKRVGAYCNTPLQIIDGGRLKKRKMSTIVRFKNGKIEILRAGAIKIISGFHECPDGRRGH